MQLPTEIRISSARDALTLSYGDLQHTLDAEFLRVYSPSAQVRGHTPGQEVLQTGKLGVLITDHNVRETLRICDKAYIISDGTVLACGKPEELVNDERVRAVYLGEHFDY